jgi:hypothetical protein
MKPRLPRPGPRRQTVHKGVRRLHLVIRADIMDIIAHRHLRRMVHQVGVTMVRRLRHRPGNKSRNFNFLSRPIAKFKAFIATIMKSLICRKSIEKDNFHQKLARIYSIEAGYFDYFNC